MKANISPTSIRPGGWRADIKGARRANPSRAALAARTISCARGWRDTIFLLDFRPLKPRALLRPAPFPPLRSPLRPAIALPTTARQWMIDFPLIATCAHM